MPARSNHFVRLGLLSLLASLFSAAGCAAPKDASVIDQADQVQTTLKPAIEEDPKIGNYFTTMGRRIQSAAQQLDAEHVGPKTHYTGEDNSWMFGPQIEFHLVNSKTLNAFTTGGHHVYVYNQLLQTCAKEEDLAAVMSHEFAHIYCRHVAQGISRQQKAQGFAAGVGLLGAALGGKGGSGYGQTAAGLAVAAAQYIGMGYTRKDEAQADEFGIQFYTRAGWDPNHFGDFFQTMINLGYDKTPAELSDHPTLASRVQAARQRVAEMGPRATANLRPDILAIDPFNQLKSDAANLAARTPNDTQLQQAQQLLSAFPSCVAPAETPEQKDAQTQLYQMTNQAPPTKDEKQRYEHADENP